MNYLKIYNDLIDRAKNRKLEGYKEKHHIVPKCLGGSRNKDNLVELTPKEHFLAHQLLVKIYPKNKSIICALSRKLTNLEALDVYKSTDSIDDIAKKYNISRYNVFSIKRKIFYRNVTKEIKDLPGYSSEDLRVPIPLDLIPEIFYDTGDYKYFWEKYRARPDVVKGIKNKKSFKSITSKLGIPGQIKRFGMTRETVEEVFNSKGTSKEIAQKFGIHYNTVRNIKRKHSRAWDMWEEF